MALQDLKQDLKSNHWKEKDGTINKRIQVASTMPRLSMQMGRDPPGKPVFLLQTALVVLETVFPEVFGPFFFDEEAPTRADPLGSGIPIAIPERATFGPKTAFAVRLFQKQAKQNLQVDGFAGISTLHAMDTFLLDAQALISVPPEPSL